MTLLGLRGKAGPADRQFLGVGALGFYYTDSFKEAEVWWRHDDCEHKSLYCF